MIVAFTAWESRISPVFDESRTLFIADICDDKVLRGSVQHFNPKMQWHLVEFLNGLKIDVLICGAISEVLLKLIESTGIVVIPFVAGKIEEVVELVIKGDQIPPNLMMPGFGRRHRGRSKPKQNMRGREINGKNIDRRL